MGAQETLLWLYGVSKPGLFVGSNRQAVLDVPVAGGLDRRRRYRKTPK